MRLVWDENNLKDAWDSAKQEAKAAFGNDGMYMEKFIEDPRHIEIQIIGDQEEKQLIYQKEIALSNVVTKS